MPQFDSKNPVSAKVPNKASPSLRNLIPTFESLFQPGWTVVRDQPTGICVRGKIRDLDYSMQKDISGTVLLAIPKDFQLRQEKLNLGIHLHGFLKANNFKLEVQERFHFEKLLSQADRKDSILVVPESKGDCLDYLRYFRSGNDFERFSAQIESSLRRSGILLGSKDVNSIFLSAHSGAGTIVESILKANGPMDYRTKIDHVVLLDATYSGINNPQIETLQTFKRIKTAANRPFRLDVLYASSSLTATGTQAEALKVAIPDITVRKIAGPTSMHWGLVNELANLWKQVNPK